MPLFHKEALSQFIRTRCERQLRLNLSPYLSGAGIDLAIIDACHDPDYVVNDFLKVVPFVAPGGVVLLHDTHPCLRGHLWNSYVGCMRLRRCGYSIKHITGTWWGVWTAEHPVTQQPPQHGLR